MEKATFKTTINAPKEKVWKALWDDASYRDWTSAFNEGSYAQTDNWKKGTEVKFLSPSGEGMVALIEENRPNEFMSFQHLGMIGKDGTEDRTSDAVKQWAGAHENYTLKENNGVTEVLVDMDLNDEYKEMFSQMWPKALARLKSLAEKN